MLLESLGKTRAFITHIQKPSSLLYIITATIDGFKGNIFYSSYSFVPGAGARVIFPHLSYRSQYVPFTSSNDMLPEFEIAVKVEEGWTEYLGLLEKGDALLLAKPHNQFSYVRFPQSKKIVFLVSASGIFPVISMLRHMALHASKEYQILLLWGAHNRLDLAYQNEIQELCTQIPRLTVIPSLTHDPLWAHEKGRFNEEKLTRLISGFFGFSSDDFLWELASYWISGNQHFTESMTSILRHHGALKKSIHCAPPYCNFRKR